MDWRGFIYAVLVLVKDEQENIGVGLRPWMATSLARPGRDGSRSHAPSYVARPIAHLNSVKSMHQYMLTLLFLSGERVHEIDIFL